MRVFVVSSEQDYDLTHKVAALLCDRGHRVLSSVEVMSSSQIGELSAVVRSSDAVIGVVTSQSPGVFYELGVAVGTGVPMLLASFPRTLLPGDLTCVPYLSLSGDNARDSESIVRRAEQLPARVCAKAESFESAEAALQAAAKDLEILETLSHTDLESLLAQLFSDRGFTVERVQRKRDVGVDLLLKSQTHTEAVIVEVKKLSKRNLVSVDAVRHFLNGLSTLGASAGMLIAPSGFTAAARALADGSPVALCTLDEVLAAKSTQKLFEQKAT